MQAPPLGPSELGLLRDLFHLAARDCRDAACQTCRAVARGTALSATLVVEAVRFQHVHARKGGILSLLDLVLCDFSTNERVRFSVWGQLAEDRLKYTVTPGSVVVIAGATLAKADQLSGILVAQTLPGLTELEWVHVGVLSDLSECQRRCADLLAWITDQQGLRMSRAQSELSIPRRCLRLWAQNCRPGLGSISLRIPIGQPAPLGPSAHVEAIDCENCSVRLLLACQTHAATIAQAFAAAHTCGTTDFDAHLRGAVVGTAYHGSIKRLVLHSHAHIDLRVAEDTIVATTGGIPASVAEESPLQFLTWPELVGALQCTPFETRRVALQVSLLEVLFCGQGIAENIVVERYARPVWTQSQHVVDCPAELNAAYKGVRLLVGPPRSPRDVSALGVCLGSAAVGKEVEAAMARYALGRLTDPISATVPGLEDAAVDRAVCWMDDRALTGLFLGIPAGLVALSLLRRRSGVVAKVDYAALCDEICAGLLCTAKEEGEVLVVLRVQSEVGDRSDECDDEDSSDEGEFKASALASALLEVEALIACGTTCR